MTREAPKLDTPAQPYLPLDDRFRQAEQYALHLELPPREPPPQADWVADSGCPRHRVFVYGCPYCDPR